MSDINKKIEQIENLLQSVKNDSLNKDSNYELEYKLKSISFLSNILDEIVNDKCLLNNIIFNNHYDGNPITYTGSDSYLKNSNIETGTLNFKSQKFGNVTITGSNLFKKSY